jgi:hypothetical protein
VFTIAIDIITRTVNLELVDIDQEFDFKIFSKLCSAVNKTISIRITWNDKISENNSLKTLKQFNNIGCDANYSV